MMNRKLGASGAQWPNLKAKKLRFSRYATPGIVLHRLIESDGSASPTRDEIFSPRESLYEHRELECVSPELLVRSATNHSFSSYSATSSLFPTLDATYGGPLFDSPTSTHSTSRSTMTSSSRVETPFSDTISPIRAAFGLAAPPSSPCRPAPPATDYAAEKQPKSVKQQGRLRRVLSTVSLHKVKVKQSPNNVRKHKSVVLNKPNTLLSARSSIEELQDVPTMSYIPPVPAMPHMEMLNRRPSKLKGLVSRFAGAKKTEKGVLSSEITPFRIDSPPDVAQLDARLDDAFYEQVILSDPEPAYSTHDWYESVLQRAASYEKEMYEESFAIAY